MKRSLQRLFNSYLFASGWTKRADHAHLVIDALNQGYSPARSVIEAHIYTAQQRILMLERANRHLKSLVG